MCLGDGVASRSLIQSILRWSLPSLSQITLCCIILKTFCQKLCRLFWCWSCVMLLKLVELLGIKMIELWSWIFQQLVCSLWTYSLWTSIAVVYLQEVYILRTVAHGAMMGMISSRDFVDLIVNVSDDKMVGTMGKRRWLCYLTNSLARVLSVGPAATLLCTIAHQNDCYSVWFHKVLATPLQTRLENVEWMAISFERFLISLRTFPSNRFCRSHSVVCFAVLSVQQTDLQTI